MKNKDLNTDTPTQNRFKKWFKDNFSLTVYDITIFGILIALYIIVDSFQRFVLTGPRNVSITYAIFIIFGIILGPIKSAILSILCDTVTQLIYGIQFWMPEYAIVPVLIAVTSGLIFKLRSIKTNWILWLIGLVVMIAITATFISVISVYGNAIKERETSLKGKNVPFNIVLIVSIVCLSIIWIITFGIVLTHHFAKTEKVKQMAKSLFIIFLNIIVIIVLYRWFWGPFAYINYHNRFRSGTWKYDDYYFIFMIPIIFKSLIEIPVYTVIIFSIQPTINYLETKYKHENKQRNFN